MPGFNKRAGVDEDEDDASSPASTSSKRPRYDDRDASIVSEAVAAMNGSLDLAPVRRGQDDDVDEYSEEAHQPGSIVRVSLTNFVTYTAVEFHPGPSLNMVIGPNGTGKSTLVCAICLGLGFPPSTLGRAKEPGEFVKHGNNEAVIEIELAAAAHQKKNPVIRRQIQKDPKKTNFFIDGRQSTLKDVKALISSFNIQIDNLCQFLPQDRVVEFAGLAPIELLKETMRAAASPRMLQWHEELKTLSSEEKALDLDKDNEDVSLKQLQAKQNATRADVDRWNQRQALVERQKALERCRPLLEMELLRKEFESTKAERVQAVRDLGRLKAEAEPARLALEDMKQYRDQIQRVRNQRKSHVSKSKERVDKALVDIKSQQGIIKDLAQEVEAEKGDTQERRQELARIQQSIATLERRMNEAPVEVDDAGYKEQRDVLQERLLSAKSHGRNVRLEAESYTQKLNELMPKLQTARNERKHLDTHTGQQADLLKRIASETAQAWEWIQKNQENLQLKGEIHGPPILTCSVPDPQYVDIVESQLRGISEVTAITFTNGDDQTLVSNKLFGKGEGCLGLHNITLRMVGRPLSFYRPPVRQEELQNLGFEAWIIDYVKGPEPVMAMLCENARLHQAAYSPKSMTDEQHKSIEDSPVSSWVAGRERFKVAKRREYGISSTSVNTLQGARFFIDQPVDETRKSQLDATIKDLEREIDEHKKALAEITTQFRRAKNEEEDFQQEMNKLDEAQKSLKKARAEYDALPRKKAAKEAEMVVVQNADKETNARILNSKAKAEEATLKWANHAISYQKFVAILRSCHESLVEAEIRLVEANSELESLKAENLEILQNLKLLEDAAKELATRVQALKNEHQRKASRIQAEFATISDELKELIAEFRAEFTTREALDNEMIAVEARLGLMADGNPHAVQAYEERERDIQQREDQLHEIEGMLEEKKARIQEIREQWEPELDNLVGQISAAFSHNFEEIGCAGQVGVYKDEDFAKWSIQIEVKFREHETLSILDSQRQSGGERAVSTIFYLMALQSLAVSPFRVVDEINQGMDPRNERMVHERMVDIACREHTSQYFLITPKLLNNLKYHPKMRIHCIASGEHMPDQFEQLDFQRLAKVAIRNRIGAAA